MFHHRQGSTLYIFPCLNLSCHTGSFTMNKHFCGFSTALHSPFQMTEKTQSLRLRNCIEPPDVQAGRLSFTLLKTLHEYHFSNY
uniref:Uncharacterized protein n=1 Tax=Anguilla anguilla TaxID=7936 RepID=A0A0E9X436_ANGAN